MPEHNDAIDPAADFPEAGATNDAATPLPDELELTVRRQVNLGTFFWAGVVLGVVLATVFTFAFPEHPEFNRAQVFGFLLVFVTALTALLACAVALIINAIISRKRGTATVRRVD